VFLFIFALYWVFKNILKIQPIKSKLQTFAGFYTVDGVFWTLVFGLYLILLYGLAGFFLCNVHLYSMDVSLKQAYYFYNVVILFLAISVWIHTFLRPLIALISLLLLPYRLLLGKKDLYLFLTCTFLVLFFWAMCHVYIIVFNMIAPMFSDGFIGST
jgi:hypothetical protein